MKTFLKNFASKAVTATFIAGDTMCHLSAKAHANLNEQTFEQSQEELRILAFMAQHNYMGMHKDVVANHVDDIDNEEELEAQLNVSLS